jgi:hypothetical protein
VPIGRGVINFKLKEVNMNIFGSIFGTTHFYVDPQSGKITAFSLDSCETCGHLIQAANSLTLLDPALLVRFGMVESDVLPPTGWHDEDTGMEVCEVCDPRRKS